MILSSKGTDVAIVLFALYHGWSALDLVHTAMSAKCQSVLHTKQTELRSLGTAVAVVAHSIEMQTCIARAYPRSRKDAHRASLLGFSRRAYLINVNSFSRRSVHYAPRVAGP